MLTKVRLRNFQRHRELEVDFNAGLTALRGANEAGKSTLLRAVCYAAFGVKGLGATLDELVTWGEDVKTLSVQLEMEVDGTTYMVKRGKSGAELVYMGGTVTGQNEVTAFVCRLIGCDAGAATRLILANQGEIRGALAAGAAETTKLIERLAEFDQIDEIIEVIQEKLSLGSTTGVEQAITAAEKRLDEARALAKKPDFAQMQIDIDLLAGREFTAERKLVIARDELEAAKTALNEGKVALAATEAVAREIQTIDDRILDVDLDLKEQRAVPAPDKVDVEALRQRIADAGKMDEIRAKYAKVEPFLRTKSDEKFAANEFQGTIDDLDATIQVKQASRAEAHRLMEKAKTEARLLRQQITDGSCGFCGQDFSDVASVKEKNAALQAKAETFDAEAARRSEAATILSVELDNLQDILHASKPALKVLDVVGAQYAELADDVLPPHLKWIGPDVTDQEEDVADLRMQIKDYETAQRAFERAAAKIETLTVERERLYRDREDAYGRRARGPLRADLSKLQAALDAARDAVHPLQSAHEEAKTAAQRAVTAKADAQATYDRAKAAVKAAEADLSARRKELDELEFNNGLLKRVRQCRPMIADQLWNLVLSAVSTYFSEMRGVKSRVRKSGDGFTVDGKVVNGVTMSGSTLDVLGLAIRVALVRTFLPSSDFFILDEPAAACDDDRTSNMLGFLAGCGFKQVLLVTHEETSQAVADNMITL